MPVSKPSHPIKVYRHALSGHAHRVELFLSLMGLPYTLIDVDLRAGEHKQPAFLAKNPLGQVPVIEDGAVTLADSNAILVYLATAYDDGTWMPRDPVGAATVQRWLSLAAGPLRQGPCEARLITVFGDKPSIADVAGYSYIAKAPEGGISLEPYPAIRAWLARIEALPGFAPFKVTKAGLLAA